VQPARDATDWSVLASLLRAAQREGWRVEFGTEGIRLFCLRATERVVVLPCALLGQARAEGWQVATRRGHIALRHPAVRQQVRVQLGA
jgi:hypothetical protein